MKTLMLVLGGLLPAAAMAANCTYNLDPSTVKVSWTAFKTTEKTPVGGSFPAAKLETKVKKNRKHLKDLLVGLKTTIHLKDETALTTGNPGRDKTLFDHFFSHFKQGKIQGEIVGLETGAHENDGTLNLKLSMNDKTTATPLPLVYTLDETNGLFKATGPIDILAFDLQGPFDELHKNCEELHKGKDGVSKTWSTVDVTLTATVTQKCSK